MINKSTTLFVPGNPFSVHNNYHEENVIAAVIKIIKLFSSTITYILIMSTQFYSRPNNQGSSTNVCTYFYATFLS